MQPHLPSLPSKGGPGRGWRSSGRSGWRRRPRLCFFATAAVLSKSAFDDFDDFRAGSLKSQSRLRRHEHSGANSPHGPASPALHITWTPLHVRSARCRTPGSTPLLRCPHAHTRTWDNATPPTTARCHTGANTSDSPTAGIHNGIDIPHPPPPDANSGLNRNSGGDNRPCGKFDWFANFAAGVEVFPALSAAPEKFALYCPRRT
jgi:hypothetical protein